MQWFDIPWSPPPRTLRQFAVLWILFFGSWASWQWFVTGNGYFAALLLALAVAVGLPGLVRPRLLRPAFVGWLVLVFPLGWLVSRLLLASVFYGLITPMGFVFRLIGRDALALRSHSGQNTYWQPKPMPDDVRSYYRQS